MQLLLPQRDRKSKASPPRTSGGSRADADATRNGTEAEALRPPRPGDSQAQLRLAHNVGEAGGFCREYTAAKRGQAIVTAPGIVVARTPAKFLHQLALNQLLKIVVESARSKFVFPLRLAGYVLHDAVAMEILGG